MKTALLILASAGALCGQIAFVQSGTAAVASTPSLTFGSTVAAHDNIHVCVVIQDGTNTVSSITDPNGDTFVASDKLTAVGSVYSMQIWLARNVVGGANSSTITANLSGGTARFLAHETSGTISVSSPVDQTWSSSALASSSGTADLGSLTTTVANDYVFACEHANGGTFTVTNSFNVRETPFSSVQSDDKTVSAGSVDVGWTFTGSSVNWIGHAVAFEPAGASGLSAITALPGGSWSCTGSSPTYNCTTHERQLGGEVFYLKIATTGTFGSTVDSGSGLPFDDHWCNNGTGASVCVAPTSGSVNPEYYIGFDGYTDYNYGPATYGATTCASGGVASGVPLGSVCTYTGSITITGGFTINVTLIIDAYHPPTITYPAGACTGCSTISVDGITLPYPDAALVAPPDMVPNGTFVPPSSAGGTYTDPNFGGLVHVVAPPLAPSASNMTAQCNDAIATTFNADGSLMFTCQTNGTVLIQSTVSPYATLWTNPPGNSTTNMRWSSIDPKAYFWLNGNSINKVILSTPGNTTCNSAIYNSPYTGSGDSLSDGGDMEVTKDDWLAYATCNLTGCLTSADQKLILINGNVSACSNTASAYVYDLNSLTSNGLSIRNLQVTNIDISNGKRYIVVQSSNGINQGPGTRPNEIFSFDGTTITDVGPEGMIPHLFTNYDSTGQCNAYALAHSQCSPTGHRATCEVAGIQGVCSATGGRSHPSITTIVFSRLSCPSTALMSLDVLQGGCSTTIAPIDHQNSDTHSSFARRGNVWFITSDGDAATTTWKVVAMSGNGVSPVHVTSDTAYSGANGDVLNFSNVAGNTALNGVATCTVANLSGTGFDCTATTGNGTYVASTGVFYKDSAHTMGPHFLENDIIYTPSLSVPSMIMLRHSLNRSWQATDAYLQNAPNPYYDQAHGTISQDGSKIMWESDMGFPDRVGVYSGLTGFLSTFNISTAQGPSALAPGAR